MNSPPILLQPVSENKTKNKTCINPLIPELQNKFSLVTAKNSFNITSENLRLHQDNDNPFSIRNHACVGQFIWLFTVTEFMGFVHIFHKPFFDFPNSALLSEQQFKLADTILLEPELVTTWTKLQNLTKKKLQFSPHFVKKLKRRLPY